VGSINFNSPIPYMITGASTLTLDVTTGSAGINVLQGSHAIAAQLVLNDDLLINVAAASAMFSSVGGVSATGRTITKSGPGVAQFEVVRAAALAVVGGTFRITEKPDPNDDSFTSVVSAYSIAPGAQLDLSNNSMVADYSGDVGTLVDDTRQHLLAERLTSSSGTKTTGLGYGDNALLGFTVFAGQSVDDTALLIKFTYFGDSDLDGDVDVADLGNLATAWQTAGVWTDGDFDYNGSIDVNDLGLLATNWQAGVTTPLGAQLLVDALESLGLPAASIPEPSAMVLSVSFVALSLRRTRKAH
jgi:hypothetical protein